MVNVTKNCFRCHGERKSKLYLKWFDDDGSKRRHQINSIFFLLSFWFNLTSLKIFVKSERNLQRELFDICYFVLGSYTTDVRIFIINFLKCSHFSNIALT